MKLAAAHATSPQQLAKALALLCSLGLVAVMSACPGEGTKLEGAPCSDGPSECVSEICCAGRCQRDACEACQYATSGSCGAGRVCCDRLQSCATEDECNGTGGTGGVGGSGGLAEGGGGSSAGGAKPIMTGTFDTVESTDAVRFVGPSAIEAARNFTGNQNLAEDDNYIVVSGGNGQVIHRLSDGAIVHDFTPTGGVTYDSQAIHNTLFSIGPTGYSIHSYDPASEEFSQFAQLGAINLNVTGLTPVPDTSGTGMAAAFIAINQTNTLRRLDALPGGGFVEAQSGSINTVDFAVAGIVGSVVHAYSPPGLGGTLGISEDTNSPFNGQLWWADMTNTQTLSHVGSLPAGPRRVVCLEPAGSPCAISSFFAQLLTLVDWPLRSAEPTIGDSLPVAGPIGIDIAEVDGVPTVASTGFNDGTLHLTTIGPNLTFTDQSFSLIDCDHPGHVIILPGGEYLVLTCNDTNTVQVHALPLSL